jgi:hypothetical protein
MSELTFSYAYQGHKTELKIPEVEIQQFETNWKNKIASKYGDSLISPTLYVAVSNDGTIIFDSPTLIDSALFEADVNSKLILQFINAHPDLPCLPISRAINLSEDEVYERVVRLDKDGFVELYEDNAVTLTEKGKQYVKLLQING